MVIRWYTLVTNDLGKLPDFIAYYEKELEEAKKEVKILGKLEKNIAELPGITEFRFNQLQEINAILNYMNIQLRKIKSKYYRKYREKYNRDLARLEAEKYAEGEDEVIDYEVLINEVALLSREWDGIMKGLETKQWQLGHIVRLRVAGMEDISIG